MKNIIIYLITLILISCTNLKSGNGTEELERLQSQFVITENYDYLDSIYLKIKDQKINESNLEIIVTSLMYLRKYHELDSILENFETKDSIVRERQIFTHNLVKHLNRTNSNDSKFIEENIYYASERIRLDKEDSLAYVNLFISLIYMEGKEKTLQKIDTLEMQNKNYTSFFYENILREVIKGYPEEFYKELPKVGEVHKTPIATSK